MLRDGMRLLKKRPTSFIDCVEYARTKFETLFSYDIKQLLHVYPLDSVTEGVPFWSLPKRPPSPAVFDKTNPLHRLFVTSLACLRANIFFIEIPSKNPRSEEFRLEVADTANFFKMKPFVPNDEKAKEIQDQVTKMSKKGDEEEKKEGEPEEEQPSLDQSMKEDFAALYKSLKIQPKSKIDETIIKAEVFEKDLDSNHHIDFMYAMANCRS